MSDVMTEKLTEWFPSDIKPVRIGVYERKVVVFGGKYSYWDGKKWGGWGATKAIAVANGGLESIAQDWKWRGLAVKP